MALRAISGAHKKTGRIIAGFAEFTSVLVHLFISRDYHDES